MKTNRFVLLVVFIQILLFPVFATEVTIGKAGKLRKILLKERLSQIDSLSIVGEINGTDILALKEMPLLEYLDLRKCHIVKGGKPYYINKKEKLKLKTKTNVLSSFLFDHSFKSLKYIVLPESLIKIEMNGIQCGLDFLHLTSNKTKIFDYVSNIVIILDSADMIDCFLDSGKHLKNIQVCNGLIRDRQFAGYKNLETVIVHKNVSSMGSSIFEGCDHLRHVEIHAPIHSLEESTFENCKSLRSLQLPLGLNQIMNYCFYNCSSLDKINLSDNITVIGNSAFKNCTSLREIGLSNDLLEIKDEAFYNCSSLVKINLSDNVEVIGNSAFKNCTSLYEVRFSNNLLEIKDEAFCNTSLSFVTLPNSLVSLGDNVWSRCSLKRIEYPKNVVNIGKNDFSLMPDLSIYMNSVLKPSGDIKGCYTTLYIPAGSFDNYKEWSDNAYVIDAKNPICKTIYISDIYDVKSIRYTDVLKVVGDIDSESFNTLLKNIRMVKILDLSQARYTTTQSEINIAHAAFLKEEKKKKEDKDLSEFLGIVAAGASLYAEYFMGPLTGTMTKIIADEVQKGMDEDVRKYEEGVFYADTVRNNLVLSDNLSHIRNLSSIYLPSNVDNLFVDREKSSPLNLYVNDCFKLRLNIKNVDGAKFFVPAEYEQLVKSNPNWEGLIYKTYNRDDRYRNQNADE